MYRFRVFWICVMMLLPVAGNAQWQTAASAEYSLLWKRLTFTRLMVKDGQPPPARDILDPGYAKRIVIEYDVGVSAERFREMTWETLQDAYEAGELSPHRGEIERFCSWFISVRRGDRYSLSWQPQQGLELSHNGRTLGNIADPSAARLILSVWLGKAAISESQRDEMLSQWRRFLAAR